MSGYRTRISALALVCVLGMSLTISLDAQATETIVAHEATYKLRVSFLGGSMKTVVAETENGFVAKSVIKATGFARLLMHGTIEESSEFIVGPMGVQPIIYSSSNTLLKKDKFMIFEFDWANDVVSGKINNDNFVLDFEGEIYDRVSIQYELMHKLLNGVSSAGYALLDGDKLKQLQVTNIGMKSIKTPFGKFEAVGIQHQAQDSTRVSTLWCAPELGYLPVLMEQHRNGKRRVRAVLTNYTVSK